MQKTNATPEQAQLLTERLDEWDALLKALEEQGAPKETLVPSRRILENYRRTLRRDLARGIERVPASELFRALSTADASLTKLQVLKADLSGAE